MQISEIRENKLCAGKKVSTVLNFNSKRKSNVLIKCLNKKSAFDSQSHTLTLLSVFSIFRAKKAIFKEESTLSMGPRLSKNILEIQQIESGTLAKFWSDGRNVAKVIANFVQPF